MGHTCGVKVDGAAPRGFLRFLSLTALRAEGCGIALSGDEYYNAAFRRSRPHRVSYSFLPSYIPTSLDGVSLDSRVAGLPYESSSLAHPSPLRGPLPLKGTQERYGIGFQCHMAK